MVPGEDGQATGYRLNGVNFAVGDEGVAALRTALIKLYRGNPELRINLRADRSTEQQFIDPILNAITGASSASGRIKPARVNLVVTTYRGHSDA